MARQRRHLSSVVAWTLIVGGLCAAAKARSDGDRPPPGSAAAWAGVTMGGAEQQWEGSAAALATATGAVTVTVRADQPGAAIPATLYGIFFEDINFAADGGIYPERIKNRSFEFPDALMGWKRAAVDLAVARGSFTIATDAPPSAQNPHYLRLTSTAGSFGVTNDGFRGIGVRTGERYRFSMLARLAGDTPVTARIELENARNTALGGLTLTGFTREWRRYTGTLASDSQEEMRARLRVVLQAQAAGQPAGALDIDMVSLFPEDTWKGRENGLRMDLVQLLKDLQPGFLRFPGGCIVEGRFLDQRYQWKTTIGDPAERRLIVNRWNDEFPHRAAPDYYQSFGLGFFEYFQLAEDLGAEPLPILNCGMACQFNSNELAPLDAIDPYVQDALDLIEFANGPVTSAWGRKRADMGHPQPFDLKVIGVGNEQWGAQYLERYALFAKTLKAKHPEIRLVSSAGPGPAGEQFDFLWKGLRAMGPQQVDLVDEHYYMPPAWFLANTQRYDRYPRQGPKVFAGEYAAHAPSIPARGQRPSTLATALAEAAFMTGLERNADIVELSSFAPLLAHVDAWQWTPNLIWFDNLRSFGTPSYYVQKLFGTNRGTRVLPVTIAGAANAGASPSGVPSAAAGAPAARVGTGNAGTASRAGAAPGELFATASLDAPARTLIVKLVNPTAAPRIATLDLRGAAVSGAGRAFVLTGDPDGENSLREPTAIAPAEEPLAAPAAARLERTLPAHSLTVLRLPIK